MSIIISVDEIEFFISKAQKRKSINSNSDYRGNLIYQRFALLDFGRTTNYLTWFRRFDPAMKIDRVTSSHEYHLTRSCKSKCHADDICSYTYYYYYTGHGSTKRLLSYTRTWRDKTIIYYNVLLLRENIHLNLGPVDAINSASFTHAPC